ncbi:MAG TPA: TlpA disulfide reductase family protein [Polyangiaceae bacterium]
MTPTSSKPTRSATPAWASLAVLLLLSVLFGLFILPRFRPSDSRLVGIPAPAFTLPVLDVEESGNRLSLDDLQGKAVILDFWASWCRPCREQMGILDGMAERLRGQGVVIVGVNTGDGRPDALAFLRGRPVTYTSVFDATRQVTQAYDVDVLPTLVLIDRAGRIAAVRSSVVSRRELDALLEESLKAN